MSGDVIPFPVAPKASVPHSRVTIVDVTDRDPPEYAVGIEYKTGEYILAGAYYCYAEALDAARQRAAALGVQAVDFTGASRDGNGGRHG